MKSVLRPGLKGLVRTTALAAGMTALGLPTMAGDHWLSRAHLYGQGDSKVTISHLKAASLDGAELSTTSSTAVFDIVISLEENPTGDDDASVDAGTSDDAQNAYENRIKKFADAVYESTNGAHKIGRVTVYRDYQLRNLADVQWEKDCASNNGPWAHPGGFQKSGKYIHFCTNWPGSSSMSSPNGSGYTLAHEWGHYAYNIFDEYAANQCKINASTMFGALCPAWQPRATDTVSDTIMHNQWYAASGTVRSGYGGASADYLEFSTQNSEPFVTALGAGDTGRNGQERYFGESGWETLTRNPATDPTWPGLDRTQYTTLTAPTSADWIVTGGVTGAQSELDIRWVGDQVVELSIDTSGSMGGTPIANAKTGASILISTLPEGTSAIGVTSFDTGEYQNYPITDIPDPDTGVKAAATAAVNGLSTKGVTSLYDGLIFALQEVKNFNTATGNTREAVVYVLSDGGDNDSVTTEADVIFEYQNYGVPIVAFGYGSGAPTGTLAAMASATGGLYLQSPTTVGEITAALLSANAAFSNAAVIGSGTEAVPANGSQSQDLPIDSSLAKVNLALSFDTDPANMSFVLRDPGGSDTGAVFDCSGTAFSGSCTAELDSAFLTANGTGTYVLEATNATASDVDVTATATGEPKAGQGYNVAVSVSGGLSTVYPKPMLIEATVRSDTPITGLDVTATIKPPFGASVDVDLNDDGTDGDAIPDDGTYTGSYHYTGNGVHSVSVAVDNASGNAQTTAQGIAVSVAEDGTVTVPPPVAISENFARASSNTTVVASWSFDDHTNDPLVPVSCTALTDDNVKVPGRIDSAGDVDCFFFTPTSTSDDLVGRITKLAGGMEPTIKIYNADGSTLLLEVALGDSENDAVGTVATIPASALDAAGHVVTVEHGDPAAAKGSYEVSVGAAQISDVSQVSADPGPTDPPSGGAIGKWSILVLALLALVGLRQRRRFV